MPPTNDHERREAASRTPSHPDPDGAESSTGSAPERAAPYKPKYTPLWNNVISMTGIFLVVIGLLSLLTFGLFTLIAPVTNPYVDIIGYLVVPSILILGLIIFPLGILFKSWRLHRRDQTQPLVILFPHVDLNDPRQRRAAKFAVAGTFILLPVVGVSGYHGFHHTDSVAFCAEACHAVMEPQATTYGHSAHARVPCAECHIGAGAGWFVKSKLSGTRQVLATWRNSYPRPIPPAITNLRPARETCEECHWPRKFFGAQLREIVHFASDENNTRREIDMLLKTGGGDETTGRAMGIHMHMILAGRTRYVATDDKLQRIPWVEFTHKSGMKEIYRSDGRPTSDPRPEGRERTLDCMDCHNRPAHKFRSPQQAVNIYLEIGRIDPTRGIDPTLPFIKQEAMKVLVQSYPDVETAEVQIGATLSQYYRTNRPEIWKTRKAAINRAIDKIRETYRHNFFPDMNADWQTYPDNIGHLISPGCFRCHDSTHVNQRGDRLRRECNVCHSFLNPVDPEGDTSAVQAGEFIHSYELPGAHKELRCNLCHSGGVAPVPTCAGCHVEQAEFRAGTSKVFGAFDITADVMAAAVDCAGCHDLSEPTSIDTINAMCMECHEDEEERFEGMLASWQEDVAGLLADAEGRADAEGKRVLEALRSAGPLHNYEATRKILRTLAGPRAPSSQP